MAQHVETIPIKPGTPNILSSGVAVTNSVAATVLITIPAGRTWYGSICVNANNLVGASGSDSFAMVTTAGTGVTPAAGTKLAYGTATGSSGGQGAGLSGPTYVTAPSGNAVTLMVTNSVATTFSSYSTANGILL
jgi:hypothetical protein